MSNNIYSHESPIQAIFSVCASQDVVDAAMDASLKVSGATFSGEFHEYISVDKRPKFSGPLKTANGCVALIDFDRDVELALATTERLKRIFVKRLNIIAVASEVDAGLLLRAMRAGCNEFLAKPINVNELVATLTRFQNDQIIDSMTPRSAGKVISLFGAKGGVGTTTLAVHLAIHLVRTHQKKTLLIDHHHELGHVALYLGLDSGQYHFDELVRNVDRLDMDLLSGFVMRHTSGLEVLASPDRCAIPHKTTHDEMERVMEVLKREYDFVIIDSSLRDTEMLPSIIDVSDEVYIVSTPDVAALRDVARHIEHLSLSESATAKLKIAINRSTSDDAVTSMQIEKAVRFPVSIAVPNNYADLVRSINAGEPVSPQHRSSFSQEIGKWANSLVSGSILMEKVKAPKKKFVFWD